MIISTTMSSRVKPGDVLGGKYRVERILGSGGMGVVVAAKHVDLGQRVALKFMLKEAMQDPQHAERFLREARSASQLKWWVVRSSLAITLTEGGNSDEDGHYREAARKCQYEFVLITFLNEAINACPRRSRLVKFGQ